MAPRPYFNDKGEVLPLVELMKLEKIDDWTFRSCSKAYEPTGGGNGAYGGFIYSLSAWAAAQTVAEGQILHSVSGNFILGGIPKEHFDIKITKIRDGGSYCTRFTTVSQSKGICFTSICSFKRSETSAIDLQDPHMNIRTHYSSVLSGKSYYDHPEAPSQDSEWFRQIYLPKHPDHYNPLPGLHLRKVDMKAYNEPRHPIDRRQLIFYTLRGRLPEIDKERPSTREANLHAIGHLFASDRNSLHIIPNFNDLGLSASRIASLSHTVTFHVGVDKLFMPNEPAGRNPRSPPTEGPDGEVWSGEADESQRKWFVQEAWSTRSGGGRAFHTSRLWDMETGVHLATTVQDGLVRYREGAELKL
ncbi:acyl-CoA thioesteras-like protein [Rhizodiscina lignyota]|uniref:Acyl-CoA thioesteras-like protein n=1 Tax=Rhizodiscina lignyota TaxID=1504668 RepID=A0A9P4ITI1_9PEZI|nr:acyl-CoA thioesteras-like protein [Rhizodiscina lignyota]